MSPQEQVIYLSEAEKIFTAFDKMPAELWEDEYDKYKQVLKKYNEKEGGNNENIFESNTFIDANWNKHRITSNRKRI